MVKISHTNIIVDQFSSARCNPFNKYIHFLSHIHTGTDRQYAGIDHLKGLSNSWDYGPIYCSPATKQLILLKYPKLSCLKQLQLDKQHTIALSSELQITVTMFDANHCAGGVMILFQGFMGNVLYTGDFRFDKALFSQYTYLYPHSKRNKEFKKCSLQIDFLYLDTTFLHPKFSFPSKTQAIEQLDQLVEKTIDKAKQQNKLIEFYIGIDSFGKEQVLVHLAEKFHTLITVTEDRYKNVSVTDLESDYFTTDLDAGFIHAVGKRDIYDCIKKKQSSIGIILTGWANKMHMRSDRLYAVPYSLHSSYPEIVAFVDSLRPSFIDSILQLKPSTNSTPYTNNSINLYEDIDTVEYLMKLRKDYTTEPSQEIKFLVSDLDFQKKIRQKLKLDRTAAQINKEEFNMTTTFVRVDPHRAGAKFTTPRNEQEINALKEKLKNKKEEVKSRLFNGSDSRKAPPKRIQYNGLTSAQTNPNTDYNSQSKRTQKVVEIEDSSESQPQNEEKSQNSSNEKPIHSRQSSKQNIESDNHQEPKEKNQPQKGNSIEQDPQTARRNKWRKKVDSGQIDLFGPVTTPSQKLKPTNKTSITLIRQSKPKNTSPQNSVIQIQDDDQEKVPQQVNNNSNSNSNSRKIKEKKTVENKETRVFNITNDNIEIDEKVERSPDQRSIMEFFKNSKKKIDTEMKHNSQGTISDNEKEKDHKAVEQYRQPMEIDNEEKPEPLPQNKPSPQQRRTQPQPQPKITYEALYTIPLLHCSQISLYQINMQRINSIREASIQDYKIFFTSNRQ